MWAWTVRRYCWKVVRHLGYSEKRTFIPGWEPSLVSYRFGDGLIRIECDEWVRGHRDVRVLVGGFGVPIYRYERGVLKTYRPGLWCLYLRKLVKTVKPKRMLTPPNELFAPYNDSEIFAEVLR